MARTSKRARKTSPLNLPGAFELYAPSKETVLKNIWIFGPLYAVPLLFGLHSWIWSPANTTHHWYSSFPVAGPAWSSSPNPLFANYAVVGFSIIWFLFVIIAGALVQMLAQAAQLRASEGKDLDFHKLWKEVSPLKWRLIGLYIAVGLVTVVGFLLLIIPGIIMVRRYFLSPYIMLDKKTGIRESMDISADMTKPYSNYIYPIIGVMILIGMISVIPFVGWLISFVVGMFYSVAPALRYQQLKKITQLT